MVLMVLLGRQMRGSPTTPTAAWFMPLVQQGHTGSYSPDLRVVLSCSLPASDYHTRQDILSGVIEGLRGCLPLPLRHSGAAGCQPRGAAADTAAR
jgi:hypothetical protein